MKLTLTICVFIFTSFAGLPVVTTAMPHPRVFTVNAGGNIQAAINQAACGDSIQLQAGATWDVPAPYNLPNKGCVADIRITSTSPLPSRLVTPADAPLMPRLRATSGDGIFRTATNAGYWILDGLNLTDNNGTSTVNMLVDIAVVNPGGNHIAVMRSLLYPKEVGTTNYNRALARGVWFEGSFCTLKWNYFYGFTQRDGMGQSQNSACVLTITGNNLTITENFLEGGYVSFFTGGGGESPEFTSTISNATLTQARFANTPGLVPGTTYVRFELRGSGTYTSAISFTRTSGDVPTRSDVNHTVFITKSGQTRRVKIKAVSGDSWTIEPYGGTEPNPGDSCTWVEYLVAKVTNVSGSTVTYDGSQATVGANWLTQAPNPVNAGWRLNQVVHDISITRNTFNIDNASAQYEHAHGGNNPKGWVEFKAGDRISMDANRFTGYPSVIGVTQHSNEGWTPWTKITNLSITNNFVDSNYDPNGSRQFVILALIDPYNSDEPGFNANISNNLVKNVANIIQLSGTRNASLTHNTILNDHPSAIYGSSMIVTEGGPSYGFTFSGNIAAYNTYGLNCQVNPCTPSGIFSGNVIVDNLRASVTTNSLAGGALGPIPASFSQVGFVNPAANDYRLGATSPYKGKASDGKDPGVDMGKLLGALGGTTLVPTPTPRPITE